MKRARRNHGATFQAQVALASVKGDKTLDELAGQFRVHPLRSPNGRALVAAGRGGVWRKQPDGGVSC